MIPLGTLVRLLEPFEGMGRVVRSVGADLEVEFISGPYRGTACVTENQIDVIETQADLFNEE